MKYGLFKNSKKLTAVLIVFAILLGSFFPVFARPARAQWVVFDPSIFAVETASGPAKEFGLDSVAWIVVNLIIERIAASTVKWINSGFKGSPAYVTDPEAYFTNMGDKIAGAFILSSPNLSALCGPLQAKIKLALVSNYNSNQDISRWRCSLTGVIDNMDDFMNNFESGGWEGFFELSQRQQNSPIGAYLQAENEMYLQITTRQGTAQKELDQGSGFMSFKNCKEGSTYAERAQAEQNSDTSSVGSVALADPTDCDIADRQTVTPGSVIQGQLNKVLGSGGDKLAVADEVNEIVSALLNQLLKSVVGGIGRGLRGASSPDTTSGGQTLTEQLSSSNVGSTVDYFGSVIDTSMSDPSQYQQNAFATPQDADCDNMDSSTLNSMAQESANQTGVSFEEAMKNLDCYPPGINQQTP